jgi:hypothetical protein
VRIETYLFALLTRYFEYIRTRFGKLDSQNRAQFASVSKLWANYFSSYTDVRQDLDVQGDAATWSEGEFSRFLKMEVATGE